MPPRKTVIVPDMVENHVTVALPEDLPNPTYAALIRGLQGLLHAAGLGPRSTIRPDPHITDTELNSAYREAAELIGPAHQ